MAAPGPAPRDQQARAKALARAWAAAVAGCGYAPLGVVAIEELLLGLSRELVDQPTGEAAGRAGAALVLDAHLTDPAVLAASLTVLDTHLPPGSDRTAALAGFAGGYARALRSRTLLEQERLAKAVFDALTQAERTARQNEARFRAIFGGAAIGIGISDVDGRIIEVNQAFADLLGYTAEEMRALRVPALTHPQDPPEMWEDYGQMMGGAFDHIRMEKAYYRKDGSEVWTDLTVSLIRDDAGRPQLTVAMVNDITDRHHLQARLHQLALHDPLTGLPNRAMFSDRLAEAVRGAGPAARIGVCYLDLDGFKQLNDRLGHHVGDQVLTVIAARLRDCAGQRGHLVARMGGDEFVILVEHPTGVAQLVELAEAVQAVVAEPVAVGPHRLRVTASAGVVEQPAAGADQAEVLKAADVTLYRAKAQGRGRWVLHDPHRVAEQVARYALAADLPDALERGEFSLVYQPIVGLPDLALRGVEALVRWHRPGLGPLTPDRFIDLAEETGMIVPLGQYVLREACRQVAAWQEEFPRIDLFASVNLAAAQTQEESLVDDVQAILAETGLKPSRLQLELTESALMNTSGTPLQTLQALTSTGVRVAIDDFGTGYSSLAYLRTLPVDCLKLAGPFIEGLGGDGRPPRMDEQIVDALVRLAHAIGLTVIAEGVETAIQVDRLAALGCDNAQGWHCGPPAPPADLRPVLARAAARRAT